MIGDRLEGFGRVMVVAPHPDDEILGCGGTMARLADAGLPVTVAVVTRGFAPLFDDDLVARVREEAGRAHDLLGVQDTHYLDQPAAELDRIPHSALNRALADLVREVAPDTLLLPFPGDIHLDHQIVHLSGLVAARPNTARFPRTVLCYEILSETNWNAPFLVPGFTPNLYIDIDGTLQRKKEAMRLFRSQLREFPHERSLETITALATLRGSSVHRRAAEAFVLVRDVV